MLVQFEFACKTALWFKIKIKFSPFWKVSESQILKSSSTMVNVELSHGHWDSEISLKLGLTPEK